jgi:hypothetical protein
MAATMLDQSLNQVVADALREYLAKPETRASYGLAADQYTATIQALAGGRIDDAEDH